MAHTVESQTIIDGSKNLVVKIHIHGDGASGDLSAQTLVDASAFTPAYTNCHLLGVHSTLNGFTAELLWDATTDVHAISLPDYQFNLNGEQLGWFGGIPNNAGTGRTGDINITTFGLSAATDHGTIILELQKNG